MAAQKIYDAAVATSEYQARDGSTKKNWVNVGAVLQFEDGGQCLILEKWFNPAGCPGDRGVRINFFKPKERDGQGSFTPATSAPVASVSAAAAASSAVPYDDDIPF
jgi:hypothetical protein